MASLEYKSYDSEKIKDYYLNNTLVNTCKNFKISQDRVYNALTLFGLDRNTKNPGYKDKRFLSKEEDLKLIELYKKYNYNILHDKFGYSKTTITRILKKYNINTRSKGGVRKYSINEDYFEKIDTEEKAYFLGFLYSDGNNYKKRNVVKINLQEKDKYILEKLSTFIYNDLKKLRFIRNIRESHQNLSYLEITNKKISNDLIDLGCVPKKSKILKFPTEEQVSKDMLRHFIRGYFDGDGSVFLRKSDKQLYTNFLGTFSVLEGISKILCVEANLKNNKIIECKNSIGTYRITYGGNENANKFLNFIYKNSTIHLDRKYNRFVEILKNKDYYGIAV